MPGSCPYRPSKEELAEHVRQYEDFEIIQKLKLFLVRSLNSNSDGWVPSEAWELAKAAHKAALEEWMDTVRHSEEPNMTEERGRKL